VTQATTPAHCSDDYFFFGSRLRSAVPLPSLPAWPEQFAVSKALPTITLSLGDTPSSLEDLIFSSPFLQIARDKSALITIAAVGTFYLPNSSQIVLQPAPAVQPYEIDAVFRTSIAGILLHLRGQLPLQASCILMDGRAIAISGATALGKSAIAAALVRQGATLLADGLCVFDPAMSAPHVFPSATTVRLWPDVMKHLDIPPELRLPTRPDHPGHCIALPIAAASAGASYSFPLAHLFRLGSSNILGAPETTHRHGPSAVFPARNLVYQQQLGHLLGNKALEFTTLTTLPRHTAIFGLQRTRKLSQLEQCVDVVLAALSESA
jgi:hypothetical protein